MKAMNGDTKAMTDLSDWYYDGANGLVEDHEMSYSWVKKAADLGINGAKAHVGLMLYEGEGVERNPTEAALYLGAATEMGSPQAAYYLARFYFEGGDKAGSFAKDNDKARYWLNKALDNSEFDVEGRKMAEELQKRLDEEKEENNGD